MSTTKKYLIGAAILLIALITVICFASEIQVWFMSKLTAILILLIVFCAGWLLGRYGTPHCSRREEKNIRNITEAQK